MDGSYQGCDPRAPITVKVRARGALSKCHRSMLAETTFIPGLSATHNTRCADTAAVRATANGYSPLDLIGVVHLIIIVYFIFQADLHVVQTGRARDP
jgi:hypothetical protein